MPSVRYLNQTAPFWDFIASLEEQGASHPFFAGRGTQSSSSGPHAPNGPNPWTDGWANFPWGANLPRRGQHSPPPPPGHDEDLPDAGPSVNEPPAGDSDRHDDDLSQPPPPPEDGHRHGSRHRHGRRDHDHHRHGHDHHRQGPGHFRGGRGGRGRGGCRGRGGFPGPFQPFADGLRDFSAWFGTPDDSPADPANTTSFVPDIDVFDTPDCFVVHVSLPGARKEDLGVSWDSERSELAVAGVVHRPGDEALLQHLALDERGVGEFERKVRLGSRARPAHVDADGIAARMEDGILRIDLPKLDAGYVEVHKVDVE